MDRLTDALEDAAFAIDRAAAIDESEPIARAAMAVCILEGNDPHATVDGHGFFADHPRWRVEIAKGVLKSAIRFSSPMYYLENAEKLGPQRIAEIARSFTEIKQP